MRSCGATRTFQVDALIVVRSMRAATNRKEAIFEAGQPVLLLPDLDHKEARPRPESGLGVDRK
jgi:hypothetical protein